MAPRVGKTKPKTKAEKEKSVVQGDIFGQVAKFVNKEHPGTIVSLEDDAAIFSTPKTFISTQIFGLDFAMHLDGVPSGRVICIRGDFMSGKSTLAQHIMAEVQSLGGFAVYIDSECTFDKNRAKRMGMKLTKDAFMMPQVETIEEAIKVIDSCIKVARKEQEAGNNRLVTIVWDSVAATVPQAELEAEFDDARPGLTAKLMSKALKRITRRIAQYEILLVLINQEKDRIDFFSQGKDVKTMLAEKPIMFHSTIVLRPQMRQKLFNSAKEPTGIRCIVTVTKNKLAAPFSKCEFILNFSNGADNNASKLDVALRYKLVTKTGSWYGYDGEKFHEKEFGKLLKSHPELEDKLLALKARDADSSLKAEEGDDAPAEPDDDDEPETESTE